MLKNLKVFFCVAFITMSLSTNIFAEGNLIKNGSFEEEQGGTPSGWTTNSYVKDAGSSEFKIESQGAYSDSKYVTIVNNVENDSRYIQTISAQPNKKYKLSCYIKAENIGDTGNGAVLSVEGQVSASKALRNTNGKWEYSEIYVMTTDGINSFNVTVGVGGYGAMSTGKASFDAVTAEEVDSIPDGSIIAVVEKPKADNSSSSSSGTEKKSGPSKVVWIVLAAAILIITAATYSTFKSSPSEDNNSSDNSSDNDNDTKESAGGSDDKVGQNNNSSDDTDYTGDSDDSNNED